jgi:PAS domain S-box-containing protein
MEVGGRDSGKSFEDELRKNDENFLKIFEEGPLGMAIVLPDYRFIKVNAKLCEMLGYTEEELYRIKFPEITHPDDISRSLKSAEKAFRGNVPNIRIEKRYIKKNREILWVNLTSSTIWNDRGEVLYGLAMIEDITERKKAEEALRESQRVLSTLMGNLPGMAYRCKNNREWTMEFVSEGCIDLTGYHPHELIGSRTISYGKLIHPDDQESVWSEVQAAVREMRPFQLIYRINTAGSQEKWVWEQGRGVFSPGGELVALEGFITDTTERKQAEEALKRSERQLSEAQRLAHLGSWYWDIASNKVTWSDELYRIFGLAPKEFGATYEAFLNRVHVEDRDCVDRTVKWALENHNPINYSCRIVRPGGTVRILSATGECIVDGRGAAIAMLGATLDITEQKEAEEALQSSRRRLQALSNRLLGVQEAERRHIARYLHDEIGQALTALLMNQQSILKLSAPPTLRSQIEENFRIADGVLQRVRDLSTELRPAMLDDLGLSAALRWYATRLAERVGVDVQFSSRGKEVRIPPALETACFRIAQEALTNVVRHAKARQVSVNLREGEDALELIIRDDGSGFEVSEAFARASRGKSMGLLSMQERAQLVGGEIDIDSAPSRGTEVRARFPIGRSRATAEKTRESDKNQKNSS